MIAYFISYKTKWDMTTYQMQMNKLPAKAAQPKNEIRKLLIEFNIGSWLLQKINFSIYVLQDVWEILFI